MYSFRGGAYLTAEEKRFVLRLRYFQLVTRGAIPEINAFLKYVIPALVPTGVGYVKDNLDMTITYVFDLQFSQVLLDFIIEFDILPRPAGVKVNIILLQNQPVFGFGPDEGPPRRNGNQNFENGNFLDLPYRPVFGFGIYNKNYTHGNFSGQGSSNDDTEN